MIHVGIAQYIATAVDDLDFQETTGGNVFVDQMPATPVECVAIYPQGGREADSKLPYDPFSSQIVVRTTGDPRWAFDVWEAIYSAIHGLRNVTMPDGTYLAWALVAQASPIRLGPDDDGRLRYSMNIHGEVLNPSAHRS